MDCYFSVVSAQTTVTIPHLSTLLMPIIPYTILKLKNLVLGVSTLVSLSLRSRVVQNQPACRALEALKQGLLRLGDVSLGLSSLRRLEPAPVEP